MTTVGLENIIEDVVYFVYGKFPIDDTWTIGQYKCLSKKFDFFQNDEDLGIAIDGSFTFCCDINDFMELLDLIRDNKGTVEDVNLEGDYHYGKIPTGLLDTLIAKLPDEQTIQSFDEIVGLLKEDDD